MKVAVKSHSRKGKKVSAHHREIGKHLKNIHRVGKKMHGDMWNDMAKEKAMKLAHDCCDNEKLGTDKELQKQLKTGDTYTSPQNIAKKENARGGKKTLNTPDQLL